MTFDDSKLLSRPRIVSDEVLSDIEWRLFDAMSLHEYMKHRAARGLPPLTTWQYSQLNLQRVSEAALDSTNNQAN